VLGLDDSRLFDLAEDRWVSVADMVALGWEESGKAWRWRHHLLAWEEEFVRECCTFLTNMQVQDDLADSWNSQLDRGSRYSVCGVHLFLTSS
jgi:hypothetical protein